MVEIESNDLVDGREFQGGELAKDHLGRETLIVIVDEVIESDPVPDQTHFTIGMPVQADGQQPDQRVGGRHQGASRTGVPSLVPPALPGVLAASEATSENASCRTSVIITQVPTAVESPRRAEASHGDQSGTPPHESSWPEVSV
jgi:hypothetical protein